MTLPWFAFAHPPIHNSLDMATSGVLENSQFKSNCVRFLFTERGREKLCI